MSLVGIPGRRVEDTYRNNLKHIIVSSKVLQALPSFAYWVERRLEDRLSCPTEFEFVALI